MWYDDDARPGKPRNTKETRHAGESKAFDELKECPRHSVSSRLPGRASAGTSRGRNHVRASGVRRTYVYGALGVCVMARYRTLSGDLWEHPDFGKAPLQIGWLYAYVITAQADDEGRFVADAWALGNKCFSTTHGVSEEEVTAALRYLHECGRVLLYEAEGKQLGFLTGWYEHQYIQSDRRQSSSLPPPPCEINSWEKADEVRQECADERGFDIRKITYQEALRWNQQRGYQSDNERLTQGLQTDNPGITNCKPKGRIGLQTDNPGFTDGYPEKEVEGEKEGEGNHAPAPSENEDDTAALLDECLEVIRPLCPKQLVGQAQKSTLENALRVHPRAEEFLLEECVTLAARHADGQRVHLSYLPNNVADACRKAEKSREDESPETDASRPHWTLRMTDEDTRRAEEIAAQMYEQEQRELGRLPAEEESA